ELDGKSCPRHTQPSCQPLHRQSRCLSSERNGGRMSTLPPTKPQKGVSCPESTAHPSAENTLHIPRVVFEFRPSGYPFAAFLERFEFYQRSGIEEYYLYDPEHVVLDGWQRSGSQLVAIPDLEGWVRA